MTSNFVDVNARFVDLAALSMSGSLVPSVPTQLMIKYDPPKMTIVYHFEERNNQQFFHDINLDQDLLATKSAEDVVSHLYVTEAYYFNPKQVKRSQLLRLVSMIQQRNYGIPNSYAADSSNQINIQDNAFIVGGQQDVQLDKAQAARRKNFFEKKRFINYPNGSGNADNENDSYGRNNNSQQFGAPGSANGNLLPGDRRGATNANALNSRRRFDDLQIQNKVPSHGLQPDMPAIAAMPKLQSAAGQHHLQNLPPLKGQRQGPISDPFFLNNNKGATKAHQIVGLSSQPEQTNLHQNDIDDFVDQNHQQHAVSNQLNPQYTDLNENDINQNGGNQDVEFESGTEEANNQNQLDGEFNQGSSSLIDDVNYEEEGTMGIQNNMDQYGEDVQQEDEGGEGGDGEDDEGESVYMIDGVVMRMIQIEGEENQYLMDPQGRIYDMQANFIGTANTQGLEEMGQDQQQEGGQDNNNINTGNININNSNQQQIVQQ